MNTLLAVVDAALCGLKAIIATAGSMGRQSLIWLHYTEIPDKTYQPSDRHLIAIGHESCTLMRNAHDILGDFGSVARSSCEHPGTPLKIGPIALREAFLHF